MRLIGIDISKTHAKRVFDFYKQGRLYNYVMTVFEEAPEKRPCFSQFCKGYSMLFYKPLDV